MIKDSLGQDRWVRGASGVEGNYPKSVPRKVTSSFAGLVLGSILKLPGYPVKASKVSCYVIWRRVWYLRGLQCMVGSIYPLVCPTPL